MSRTKSLSVAKIEARAPLLAQYDLTANAAIRAGLYREIFGDVEPESQGREELRRLDLIALRQSPEYQAERALILKNSRDALEGLIVAAVDRARELLASDSEKIALGMVKTLLEPVLARSIQWERGSDTRWDEIVELLRGKK